MVISSAFYFPLPSPTSEEAVGAAARPVMEMQLQPGAVLLEGKLMLSSESPGPYMVKAGGRRLGQPTGKVHLDFLF